MGLGPTNRRQALEAMPYEDVITVAKSGGDYTTLKDAMTVATPGTLIQVAPGVYAEDNPLPAVSQVTILGMGERTTTFIQASNTNQDLFETGDQVVLDGLVFLGTSGTGWIMDIDQAHDVYFKHCMMLDCVLGIRSNHAGAVWGASDFFIKTTTATTIVALQNNAGRFTAQGGRVRETSNVNAVFIFDGANAISTVQNWESFSPNAGTGIFSDNSARTVVYSSSFVGMYDGVIAQGGSNLQLTACSIFNAQQDNLRISNTGSNTTVAAQGTTTEGATRYDLNILSATALAYGFGSLSPDNISIVPGAQFVGAFTSLKEGDLGTDNYGELHVGRAEEPAEFVTGGGESYTRGMLVYQETAAGVFTDVSAEARSASGSTFAMPGIAQNNALYVASSLENTDYLQHYGIKLSQTVAAVLGGGSIVIEYWNGAAWIAINHMSSLSGKPLTQYADNIFERTGSEQLRYPLAFLSSWTKNDPITPALGTDYYWIRYRVFSAITTAPVFEQWKLHTSRFEANDFAGTEYFGEGRYPLDIALNTTVLSGFSPANQTVSYAAGIAFTYTSNKFVNGKKDGFGVTFTIPVGLDTCIPVTFQAKWYADTNNAGNVEFTVEGVAATVGDLIDGSLTAVAVTQIETVPANDQYVFRLVTLDIDVSSLVPGEELALAFYRDAVGVGPPDTLVGDVVIFGDVIVEGYFWKP